jgi:hypothetical protein
MLNFCAKFSYYHSMIQVLFFLNLLLLLKPFNNYEAIICSDVFFRSVR